MGGIVYSESYRKIDNVLYSVSKYGALRCGGKMMVFWNRNSTTHLFQSDTIYCAEKDAMEIVGANLSGMIVCFQSLSSLRANKPTLLKKSPRDLTMPLENT
ncbi:hypothetical protein YC2023_113983 [Brassica napus]